MTSKSGNSGNLTSLTEGASLFLVGKIFMDVLGFLLHFVLTRSLGASLYGIFAYGKTIVSISLVFTNLGSDKSLLKYLPEYADNSMRRRLVFTLALTTSLAGGVVAGAVLFLSAPLISDLTLVDQRFLTVLRLFAVLLVFDTLAKVLHSTFRAQERLEYEIMSNKMARPLLRLTAAIVAIGFGFSLIGVVVALVVASVAGFGLALYILFARFDLRPQVPDGSNGGTIRAYYDFSVPLTLKDAGDILLRRVDILMVGFFFTSTAVGIYNVSVLLAGILALPLYGFNQLFPPIASRLYLNGEVARLNSLYNVVTRWVFTVTLIMSLGTIVYRNQILDLFGAAFTDGSLVLVLFVLAQLSNAFGGSNGYILMMTNHQYLLVVNQWTFGVLNVILNYLFILQFGFVGAAAASAGILAVLNAIKTAEVWYLEGMFPYTLNFAKPVGAGLVAGGVMYGLTWVLEDLVLLAAGLAIGVLIYCALLFAFGIEPEEKEIIKAFLRRMPER